MATTLPTDLVHREYPPRQSLRPFVRRLLCSESEGDTGQVIPVPPTGSLYLTFVFGAPISVRLSDGIARPTPRLFVGGQLRKESPVTEISGQLGLVWVEFTPSGFYRLFQTDCAELTDRMTDFSQLLPRQAPELERHLMEAPDRAGRFELLQDFLAAFAANAVETGRLDEALALVERFEGRISVERLAEQTCISARQLHRQFLKCVGIGPKHYAKILQIKHAFEALHKGNIGELQDVAQAAGYYDQSHFIRDFQRLIGINPAALLQHPDPFLETYLRHCAGD